ncbi:recombination protein NinB [Cronobacter sakazakii]|uniref:recombination protein NinB n=1 Tax=Cronobacter sakazakii TaxID=28141 RepID=UPI001F50E704|nr:recombination protein NinB [Cronobacter sakazakii]ELY3575029.1 recombination protein NinB [Cronobacter sakazakii]MCI0322924.1 recombination protein NinB [Cronobacter sakazakii]
MRKQTFEILTPIFQQNAIRAIQQIHPDPEIPLIVTIQEKTRSVEQNKRLWATLRDVSEQVVWHGMKLDSEDWKHIFTAALKGQRSAPGINGGFVVLGQSTSKMKVSEFSELLELIYAFGAERGVRWSEDAQEAIEWAKRTGRKVAA